MSVDSELLCVCMTHVVKAAILCVFIYLIYVIALQHLYLLCSDCCRHLCGHTIVAFKHMCVHIEVGKKMVSVYCSGCMLGFTQNLREPIN